MLLTHAVHSNNFWACTSTQIPMIWSTPQNDRWVFPTNIVLPEQIATHEHGHKTFTFEIF